ncbi:CAP domain-containing protein [Aquimarina sp. D1M17]|uniref:CAP domain-containing protein n=1 Tax=Aquimarina acroporae TaxID=2937283 RepID=UPI0020BE6D00|nr:CAP domain-containing protein [Aquimarina acroporae]MCK8522154.1 CAP domain-containing protein [Aquimarina acroporae]
MKTFFKYYLCAFIAITAVVSCSDEDDTVTSPNEISITEEILKLVNEHRQSQGLSALEMNTTAEELAVDHTRYMISQGDISHDNFSSRSGVLNEKENATGTAENVASFYPDAASVVQGWLNSEGHRRNIEGNFTHTGIAALKDDQGRYYYTQIFYR